MNAILWMLQLLLAAVFAAHGWMLLAPPPDLLQIMNEQLGVPFRIFLGVAELAGAAGVILPALTRVRPGLTAIAAGCLSFVVGCATVLHLVRGEFGSSGITFILFVLAGYVAYARWWVRPIVARSGSRPRAGALAPPPA